MSRPKKKSGGLLLFEQLEKGGIKVLVAHPGGPFFTNKDDGWWSIPKGEPEEGEDMFDAALREFEEENRNDSAGSLFDLGNILQKNKNESTHGLSRGLGPKENFPSATKSLWNSPKVPEKPGPFRKSTEFLCCPLPKPGRNSGTNRCLSSTASWRY